jgi:cytochrome c biogenesis protein CcmG, thiol:disulfide interchange protein DsbE
MKRSPIQKWLPLGLFLLALPLLFLGIGRDTQRIPSVLINKPAPEFTLPNFAGGDQISSQSLRGQPYLLNVFASWCASCVVEHPEITRIASLGYRVIGLNYKDDPADAARWLAQFGNPFDAIAVDAEGRTAIDFGVYGAPETFVIDAAGVIRHKVIGPVTREEFETVIKPMLEAGK